VELSVYAVILEYPATEKLQIVDIPHLPGREPRAS